MTYRDAEIYAELVVYEVWTLDDNGDVQDYVNQSAADAHGYYFLLGLHTSDNFRDLEAVKKGVDDFIAERDAKKVAA